MGFKSMIGSFCLVWLVFAAFMGITIILSVITRPKTSISLQKDEKISVMGSEADDMFVFLHVTDIHLSKFLWERQRHFKDFCSNVVSAVNPNAIVLTGDITDAMETQYGRERSQNKEEWKYYKDILKENNLFDKNYFIDMRGNHDAYTVKDYTSEDDYFSQYGVQGEGRVGPFHVTKSIPIDKDDPNSPRYTFTAIDAPFTPGVSSPFGFFGSADSGLKEVRRAVNTENSRYTIVMSHFPHMTLTNYDLSLQALNDKKPKSPIHSYLCGHFHKQNMYARVNGGVLELEGADLKNNLLYRIHAFDHGIHSFIDAKLYDGPHILITNPKDSRFLVNVEPTGMIADSTHIRLMVFSPNGEKVKRVSVLIDNESLEQPPAGTCDCLRCVNIPDAAVGNNRCATELLKTPNSKHPLYTTPWNPDSAAVKEGLHEIHVFVELQGGSFVETRQWFSVDGTTSPLGSSGIQLLQQVPLVWIGQMSFLLVWITTFVLFIIPFIWKKKFSDGDFESVIQCCVMERPSSLKLWLITQSSLSKSSIGMLIFGWIASFVLMLIPAVGEGEGLCFVTTFGVYCSGTFIEIGEPVAYGVFTAGLCFFPSLCILGILDNYAIRTQYLASRVHTSEEKIAIALKNTRRMLILKNGYLWWMLCLLCVVVISMARWHYLYFGSFAAWTLLTLFMLYLPIFTIGKTVKTMINIRNVTKNRKQINLYSRLASNQSDDESDEDNDHELGNHNNATISVRTEDRTTFNDLDENRQGNIAIYYN
eukprot:TRINITY_DN2766_c2_g1_i1.p1 TRINITY_DN2766_c2_g1~~TRINITY_DN2766_c2_g1_i1.p1  ORF type:complete len:760 (-),score=167.57 TRINITY_DN2766_c2_g1_i1:127-2406(-)